jgi:putative tricarboxylic transport membrane protein
VTASLRRLQIAVAVSLVLLGAFATWEATGMPFGTAAMPGPAMLPMALGVLLMLAAAGLIVLELKSPVTDATVVLGNRRVALAVAAIVVAGLLFEPAGFLITSTLFLFVMLVELSALGWWRSLLAAVAASIATGYLFQNLLGVVLPPLPFAP